MPNLIISKFDNIIIYYLIIIVSVTKCINNETNIPNYQDQITLYPTDV